MPQHSDWIPMRWPSGPLELALAGSPSPETREANEAWHKPGSLAFLENSPVNCILVTWSADREEDAAQQRTLAPLLAQAQKQGIAVVGKVSSDREPDFASAKAAGLSAVWLEGAFGGTFERTPELPVILAAAPGKSRPSVNSEILGISKALWPRVPVKWTGKTGDAKERAVAAVAAGPTGAPWVDSNGWISAVAHARAPGTLVWIAVDPPRDQAPLRPEAYALAVADSAAYGSRWIISLDDKLRRALPGGDPEAQRAWAMLTEAVAFFEKHRRWMDQEPVARLGVFSDFAGPEESLAGEVLNLCNRQHLAFRVIHKLHSGETLFEGLEAVLWVDRKAPEGPVQKSLEDFVHGGGVLILPASAGHVSDGLQRSGSYDGRYDLYSAGEGRIAVSNKPWTDPYVLATDAHRLLGRRHDVVRMWNAGATNFRYTTGRDGAGLVQVINYAARPVGHPMSLYVARPYRSAKFTGLPGGHTQMLHVEPKADGVEVSLPPFAVYAAIEFQSGD